MLFVYLSFHLNFIRYERYNVPIVLARNKSDTQNNVISKQSIDNKLNGMELRSHYLQDQKRS